MDTYVRFSNVHTEKYNKHFVERCFVVYSGIHPHYIAKTRNYFWLDLFTSIKAQSVYLLGSWSYVRLNAVFTYLPIYFTKTNS